MEWELIWRDAEDGGYSQGSSYRTKYVSIWRHKTPGGWLVRNSDELQERSIFNRHYHNTLDNKSNITFVPDPNYKWDPLKPERERTLKGWFYMFYRLADHPYPWFDNDVFRVEGDIDNMVEDDLRRLILNKKKELQEYHPEQWEFNFELICKTRDALLEHCPL
jgi:hypothetical protein